MARLGTRCGSGGGIAIPKVPFITTYAAWAYTTAIAAYRVFIGSITLGISAGGKA